MADVGWIKLWRKLRDNPWLNDAVQRAVFCTLLLDAETADEHERSYGQGVAVVRRGQCLIAERALASELKLGRQQIRRALANLKKGGLINPKTNPHFTVVTICNFDRYQGIQPTDQPKANPRPTQHLEYKEGEERKRLGRNGGIHSPPSEPAISPLSADEPADDTPIPEQMVEIWASVTASVLPKPRVIDKTRRGKLLARYRDSFGQDLEKWRAYCRRILACPHLVGDNDRGWKADLDFCLEPRKCNRILEGFYQRQAFSERKWDGIL